MFAAAKEFNVQVFATMHSWECIKAFALAEGLGEDEKILFRLEKNGEETRAIDYSRDLVEAALEREWEVR